MPGAPKMVVKPKVLLALSEKCYRAFNPKVDHEDGHMDRFLEAEGVEDESAQQFIRQVFYGCRRYNPLLKVTPPLTGYCASLPLPLVAVSAHRNQLQTQSRRGALILSSCLDV